MNGAEEPTTTPSDFTEQSVTPEQMVLGTARLDSHFRKWLIEQLTAMGDGQLQWQPSPQYVAGFTAQARQLVESVFVSGERLLGKEELVRHIASFATQGQVEGIERAARYLDPVITARCTCDGGGSHDVECEAIPLTLMKNGIRALSPDPDYLDRVRNEAATAALEQATQLVDDAGKEWGDLARARKSKTYSAYVIAALDLQGRIRALKSDAAIGDDDEHGNRD